MNDQPKQDINNEVVEDAPVEAPVEQQTTEQVSEEVFPKKTIKDYLSKDLFSDIKIISGKEDDEEVGSLDKSGLSEYENTFKDISLTMIKSKPCRLKLLSLLTCI